MCYLRRIAKIRFLPVFQIWLTLRPKKNKKLLFYGHWTRYDLLRGRTSAFLIFRSFGHSYGRSRQKGRTCRRHAMTDFMSNVNTKSVSATPAQGKVNQNEKQWLKYTLIIVNSILRVKLPSICNIRLVLKQLEKSFTAEVTIIFCNL